MEMVLTKLHLLALFLVCVSQVNAEATMIKMGKLVCVCVHLMLSLPHRFPQACGEWTFDCLFVVR